MKTNNYYRHLLLLLLLSLIGAKTYAYDIAVANADGVTIYYNYINNGTELEVTGDFDEPSGISRSSLSYKGVVNIPEEVTYMNVTRKVTSIGDRAFYGCNLFNAPSGGIDNLDPEYDLTQVSIPNSVNRIGDESFAGCYELTSVIIPNTVTSIGRSAFASCYEFTSITIPNSVNSIGEGAFRNCLYLTSVTISNSVTSIGEGTFQGCGLTSITIPNSVMSIGNYAFYNCSDLASVTIPNSVTSIGIGAFENCGSLTSVMIPSSVTYIEASAFFFDSESHYGSGLISVTINPNPALRIGTNAFGGPNFCKVIINDIATWCGVVFDDEYSNPLYNAHHLYSDDNTEITDLVIPNTVTSIGDFAFIGCSALESITIPSSVLSIGIGSFYECQSLNKLIIEDIAAWCGVSFAYDDYCVAVANPLFYAHHLYSDESTEITDLVIPSGVTTISDQAFMGADNLTSVTIPSTVTSIGDDAFYSLFNTCGDVYCHAENVPEASLYAFGNIGESTLYVPGSSLNDYKNTAPWSEFGTIDAIPSPSLVVRANDYTREYGDSNPTFEYTSTDPLDGAPVITCSATETSAPGEYIIEISRGTETNVVDSYVNGTLTITKAPLNIIAKSYTVNMGDAMPTFEVDYEGFKNDETESVLDLTAFAISCEATDTDTEGTYSITVSGATSDNYDISYVAGTLNVMPTDVNITITSAGMGTYCSSYDLDFSNMTDLKAYIITGYDWANQKVYATRVFDVPAGTGLYLVGNPGSYDVPFTTSTSYYINMLVGTLEQTWINPTDGDLTNLRLTGTSPSNASFKILSEGRNFSANKAYLQIPTRILGNPANAAHVLGIVLDDETNGIEDITLKKDDTDSEWYTLDGRKLKGKPTSRGIYVVKGRKVVIK